MLHKTGVYRKLQLQWCTYHKVIHSHVLQHTIPILVQLSHIYQLYTMVIKDTYNSSLYY